MRRGATPVRPSSLFFRSRSPATSWCALPLERHRTPTLAVPRTKTTSSRMRARAICATRARWDASCGDSLVCACRRCCDAAGDNADASKFNHSSAYAVTSRVHARRVACPAHSEPPCRTRPSLTACLSTTMAPRAWAGGRAPRQRHPQRLACPASSSASSRCRSSSRRARARREAFGRASCVHVCAGSPRSLVCM